MLPPGEFSRSASNTSLRIHARHYATGQPIELLCEHGRIAAITTPASGHPDLNAGWVAPALFDLQINGCEGVSFNSSELTEEMVARVAAACRRHGIGGSCPTLVTNSFAALAHGLVTLRQACGNNPHLDRLLPAIHLEGPYISPEDGPRGAHPLEHVRPPDWQEFCRLQEAAGGKIRLVTLAPEHHNALSFIERLVRSGVVVALGHTA